MADISGIHSNSRAYKWLALFLILALSVPVVYRFRSGSKGRTLHNELVREFRLIAPPSGATVVSEVDGYSAWRPHQALVGANYKSAMPYSSLRKSYDDQLALRGWKFVEEHPIRDTGRELGGRVTEYCKGELKASLQYAGDAEYGWNFAFNLSWGLGVPDCS